MNGLIDKIEEVLEKTIDYFCYGKNLIKNFYENENFKQFTISDKKGIENYSITKLKYEIDPIYIKKNTIKKLKTVIEI